MGTAEHMALKRECVWNFEPVAEALAQSIGGAVGSKNGLQVRDRGKPELSAQIDLRVKKPLENPPYPGCEASMDCDFGGTFAVAEDGQSATFTCEGGQADSSLRQRAPSISNRIRRCISWMHFELESCRRRRRCACQWNIRATGLQRGRHDRVYCRGHQVPISD